jgi:hypothetical protein
MISGINYWRSLPRQSKLSIKIKSDGQLQTGIFTYWHSVDNTDIYGQLAYNGSSTKVYGCVFTYNCDCLCDAYYALDTKQHLHIMNAADTEFVDCEVFVINEKKSNQLPLNFTSIPSQYYDKLSKKWQEVHLGYGSMDMDQGWTDVINGLGIEHLIDEKPLFIIEDKCVQLFTGEGLWIDELDLLKLFVE